MSRISASTVGYRRAGSLCIAVRQRTSRSSHWGLLAAVLVASVSLAFLISDAGFYLFSGRYPEASWEVYTARVVAYYPHYALSAVAYVGPAALLRRAAALRPDWQAPGLPR